jgi:hypothetical protein
MKIYFLKILLSGFLISASYLLEAQSLPPFQRQSTYNEIGWIGYFGDHKISKKWGLHTEYQWRRDHFISYWQQSLARVGVNYKLNDKVMLTLGYGFIETFTYGNPPIARRNNEGQEQAFPEHRIYQDILINNDLGGFELNHRLRLEQRWLGNYYDANNVRINNNWRYLNRFRYRIRFAHSFKGPTIDPKEFYFHAYDEFFIGFGKNVGINTFDQNRINVGIGYKISKQSKIEAGYFNQIVEQPRLDTNKNPVFEYNNGFLVAITHNLDFSKKENNEK